MNKNVKHLAIALPLLTLVVWVVWVILRPSIREHFLSTVSEKVERNILKDKKRKSPSKLKVK
jgi:hypothetical protein